MNKKKLHILFICNKSPWPASEGGPIAMNNLIEGLVADGHAVKVLAINTNKYATDPKDIPEDYLKKTALELVYVDLAIKPLTAFFNLFTNNSYHVQRFISPKLSEKLIEILNDTKFDIVQIETLFMSPYLDVIRKHSRAKVFLRAHNVEHLIWQRLAVSEKNPLKKLYLGHLSRTLKLYEENILDSYDGILPITHKDARYFESKTKTAVLPISFGIHQAKLEPLPNSDVEIALFHIGSMNWMPNEEGIKWFLHEVWPLVTKKIPAIKLYLAGREMPDWLLQLKMPQVEIIGEVPDAQAFIRSKSISIAPLLSGSGIRIKIIESMAAGKAVVATRIGAEGINYTNGENMLVADGAEDFALAIEKLHKNPAYSQKLGEQAQLFIREEHLTSKIIDRLVGFYREIL